MTSRPYPKALDRALRPLEFRRKRLDWVRVRGELEETVNLQSGWLGGRTVNLWIKNLETEKLYLEIFGSDGAIQMPPISKRIGILIDNHDHWWGDEPEGPEDMANWVVRVGLPWFDRSPSLEDQAVNWYGRGTAMRGYYGPGLIGLGLTLYRMGERDEACEVLNKPVPKTAGHTWPGKVARVREWLGCPSA